MPSKFKRQSAMVTYGRSYLVTLGIVFSAVPPFVYYKDGASAASWPWWAFALLLAFVSGGFALVGMGLLGPAKNVQKWAEAASTHWASLIIMGLAYPVYLILSRYYKDRQ